VNTQKTGDVLFKTGDIISYIEMCKQENTTLQHGMNYRLHGGHSVILMNLRPNAPYADRVEDEGRILIYEGHDVPNKRNGPDPKTLDQPMNNPGGSLSRNGLFFEAAKRAENGRPPEGVRVYEKIKKGIWSFNGLFHLLSAKIESESARKVFKFRLELTDIDDGDRAVEADLAHHRIIPSNVKLEVWKRDGGKCTQCGSADNLHFDHILPFSKGGASTTAANIQLLCARHNLAKRDRIE
jgi:hypothetical protein